MPIFGGASHLSLPGSFESPGVQCNLTQPKASAEAACLLGKGKRFSCSELVGGFSNPWSAVTHVSPGALRALLSFPPTWSKFGMTALGCYAWKHAKPQLWPSRRVPRIPAALMLPPPSLNGSCWPRNWLPRRAFSAPPQAFQTANAHATKPFHLTKLSRTFTAYEGTTPQMPKPIKPPSQSLSSPVALPTGFMHSHAGAEGDFFTPAGANCSEDLLSQPQLT